MTCKLIFSWDSDLYMTAGPIRKDGSFSVGDYILMAMGDLPLHQWACKLAPNWVG